jgi:hypothetical protein
MIPEPLALILGTLLFAAVYIGLRLHHDRQVKRWIDTGLIKRKPRAFVARRRYR